ncbi:MAG TPA: sulfide/dihydroorotate dehydrogenase-like FAD/NAD-binding protein [Thermoanaerobaculia bacterium]|nr:sulfide/dihydroorotate dehydrogenase-like FAD/NAD-binding protein [Thermoanaerobaculia bacterium]
MFRIVEAKLLGPGVKQFEIDAPRIARKQRPGQFVIIRVHEAGERIPLTIKASNPSRGTITIVVQAIGKTTSLLNELRTGDAILDVVGPLGKPSEIEKYGRCVVIGGGVGTAIALPTARALRDAGNHVIAILGARTKDLLILENEVREASDELFVMTDDGSYGGKGLVTDKLKELIAAQNVDFVLAIGPVPMMRAVAETTRPKAIKTVVSLNSIMVDGTGMCGGCRVVVGDQSKFACVDGPEFDAHTVDFQVLTQRNAMYRDAEKESLEHFKAHKNEEVGKARGACSNA